MQEKTSSEVTWSQDIDQTQGITDNAKVHTELPQFLWVVMDGHVARSQSKRVAYH